MIEHIERWLEDSGRDYLEGCALLKSIGESIGDYGLVSMGENFELGSPAFNMERLADQIRYERTKLPGTKEQNVEKKADAVNEKKDVSKPAPSPHPTPEPVTDDVPLAIKQCKTLVAHLWQRQQTMQRELYAMGTDNTKKAKMARERIINIKMIEAHDHSRLSELKEQYFQTGVIAEDMLTLMRKYDTDTPIVSEHEDDASLLLKMKKAKQNVRRNEEALAKAPKETPKWEEINKRLEQYRQQVEELERMLS